MTYTEYIKHPLVLQSEHVASVKGRTCRLLTAAAQDLRKSSYSLIFTTSLILCVQIKTLQAAFNQLDDTLSVCAIQHYMFLFCFYHRRIAKMMKS